MFMREWVSSPALFDGEELVRQCVPEFRFAIERAPHRLELMTQELIRVHLTAAEVGSDDEGPIGDEHPMDLPKHRTQDRAREMVDRVERHDGREGLRSEGKHPHVAAREPVTTRALGCEAKHLHGKIQSHHISAMKAQVLSDLAGAAAEVEHRTHPGSLGRLVKDGTVDGKVTEIIGEGGDVVLRHQVVGGTDGTRIEWLHGPKSDPSRPADPAVGTRMWPTGSPLPRSTSSQRVALRVGWSESAQPRQSGSE
jgi:hypothetical protein